MCLEIIASNCELIAFAKCYLLMLISPICRRKHLPAGQDTSVEGVTYRGGCNANDMDD